MSHADEAQGVAAGEAGAGPGVFKSMPVENLPLTVTLEGKTSLAPGMSSTSSNVRPSEMFLLFEFV